MLTGIASAFAAADSPAGAPGRSAGAAISDVGEAAIVAGLSALVLWSLWIAGVGRRLRGMTRDVSALPFWAWLLGATTLILAQALGAVSGATVAAALNLAPKSRGYEVLAISGGYAVAIGAGVALAVLLARGMDARAAGLRVRPGDALVGLGCALLMAPVVQMVTMLSVWVTRLLGEPVSSLAHVILQEIVERPGEWPAIAAGVLAVVAAPVFEELVYRVFLQSGLLALFGRAWAAILGASAVFACMHIGAVPVYALPGLFVLGIAFGVAYETTRRPGVPIVMHMLFNAANVALALIVGG